MNSNVKVTTQKKNGKTCYYVVRQDAHDKPVKIGKKLFGELVIAIEPA